MKPPIQFIVLLVVYFLKVRNFSINENFSFYFLGPGSEKVDLAWIKTGVQSWSKMKGRGKDKKGNSSTAFFKKVSI